MCGFVAWWGAPVEDEPLRAALARLAHRGPDGEGWARDPGGRWALGHRRLSIVDLEGGAQPLLGPGGSALVANGEVYNHASLRAGLIEHEFRSGSDSEAILALIRARGPQAARELEGMFAFALVDGGRLVAARDALGIKPLYMGRRGDALLLASEASALAGLVRDLRAFPPGHVLDTSLGAEPRPFAPAPSTASTPVDGSAEAISAWLRATLDAAVIKRLMADVPVGAFLSGGLDSSLVAALAKRHVRELHTFSVGTPASPDLLAARRVAAALGTIHHEQVLDPGEVRDALPRIVARLESFDQALVRSAVPCWFVSRLAAMHVKVVLTGEGADELFAGYGHMRDAPAAGLEATRRTLVAGLHSMNLQRVDRMTMAHGLEARVPFLDLRVIELGLSLPATLLRGPDPDGRPADKWLLRRVAHDHLPYDVAWRPKAQFDEGTGAGDLLGALAPRGAAALRAREHRARHPGAALRSIEEAQYHALLSAATPDPAALLALVARWTPGAEDRRGTGGGPRAEAEPDPALAATTDGGPEAGGGQDGARS